MTTLSDSPNSDKGCEDCAGEGWCVHQERQRWERRRGNDWPVPARAAVVLDEDAARRRKGTDGDRARAVAATLWLQRVPWYAREPKTSVEYWTGVSPETLEARSEWPELAEALVETITRVLGRTGLLDGPALAYNAARAAVGMSADLGRGLPRDVDLLPNLPDLTAEVPGGADFIDRFVFDGRPWRALGEHAAVARERSAAQSRIAARYGRKPLVAMRLARIALSLKQEARLHGRSMKAELRAHVESALWLALWSLRAGTLVRRGSSELHSAIAREVEEGIAGPDLHRAPREQSWGDEHGDQAHGDNANSATPHTGVSVHQIDERLELDARLAKARLSLREAEIVAELLARGGPERGDLADIARERGLDEGTVYRYYHDALGKLRRAVPA